MSELNDFKFLTKIGSGGFGVVYGAIRVGGQDHGALYAVKKQQKRNQEQEIRIEVQVRELNQLKDFLFLISFFISYIRS